MTNDTDDEILSSRHRRNVIFYKLWQTGDQESP
jgi:hypothetical protein